MGWREGAYFKLWYVKDNDGKSAKCSITISKKNKETNEYKTAFRDSFVTFRGSAYEMIKQVPVDVNGKVENKSGVTFKISPGGCDHEKPEVEYEIGKQRPSTAVNWYVDKNNKQIAVFDNYTIWGIEDVNGVLSQDNAPTNNVPTSAPMMDIDTNEEELPF